MPDGSPAMQDPWFDRIAARVADVEAIDMNQVLAVVLPDEPDRVSTTLGKRAAVILIALGFTRKRRNNRRGARRYYWKRVEVCCATQCTPLSFRPPHQAEAVTWPCACAATFVKEGTLPRNCRDKKRAMAELYRLTVQEQTHA